VDNTRRGEGKVGRAGPLLEVSLSVKRKEGNNNINQIKRLSLI